MPHGSVLYVKAHNSHVIQAGYRNCSDFIAVQQYHCRPDVFCLSRLGENGIVDADINRFLVDLIIFFKETAERNPGFENHFSGTNLAF